MTKDTLRKAVKSVWTGDELKRWGGVMAIEPYPRRTGLKLSELAFLVAMTCAFQTVDGIMHATTAQTDDSQLERFVLDAWKASDRLEVGWEDYQRTLRLIAYRA